MKHVHLRPIEYKKYVNKNFIKGCPDAFNFGTTDMIKLEDAGRIMTRIFSDPTRVLEACNLTNEIADVEPTIMLVGHALSNDTEYMRRLNFSPKHVSGHIDTQKLARISKKQPPGLTKLLAALSIDAKNLHNAGNDAAYTLQALVGVAVQEHHQPGGVVEALKAEKVIRDAAKAAQKAKAAENAEKKKAAKENHKGVKPAQVASKAKLSELSTLMTAPPTLRIVAGSAGSGSNPVVVAGGSKVGAHPQQKLRGELPNMGNHVTSRSDGSRRERKARARQEHSKDGD
jgi:hypothetical protein